MRDLLRLPPAAAVDRLTREHDLDARAAENLLQYLRDQMAATRRRARRDRRSSSSACATSSATGASACCRRAAAASTRRGRWPSAAQDPRGDRHRRRDAVGRRRVRRAVSGRRRSRRIRGCCCPTRTRCRRSSCGSSARRRSSPRSSARTPARSLLLPKRRPGHARAALAAAQARRRSAGGRVALRLVPGAARDLSRVPARLLRHAGARRDARPTSAAGRSASSTVDSETPSPFAASLLFSYVASFLYDGDAPLAERRAQALAVDQAQLRELLGDAELRELLDADVDGRGRAAAAAARSAVSARRAPTACTTCCCRSAISRADEIARAHARRRTSPAASTRSSRARRVARACAIAGEPRYIAVEDAARYRDALGVPLPPGLPESLLAAGRAIRSAISRCATRARTRRSPPPTSPRATASAPAPPKRC